MDQRAAEATYGLAAGDLTPSLYSLRRDWNAAKNTVAPWWGECSKEAFSTGLDQFARALKNWGDSRNGTRKGKPARFPRFRSKRKTRPSVRFTTGAFRCETRHAVLPRIGRVRLHEDGARLAGLVLDRDVNAARNLAAWGRRQIAGSGPEIANGRGADRKTSSGMQVAVKRQPGTRQRGQAGTVPRQRGTAKVSPHAH
jgi:putative transposase